MFVFSNPVVGRDKEFLQWYSGQHIHDLLAIPDCVGCRFFKVSSAQLIGTKEEKGYAYLMIWDFETEDINSLLNEIITRKKDGRSKICPAFANQFNVFCMPVTDYITAAEIAGMNVEEVSRYSQLIEKEKQVVDESKI